MTYSDRFIPSRQRGVPLHDSFALLPDSPGAAPKKRDSPQTVGSSDAASKDDNLDTYSMLLRSELLGPDQLPSPSYRSLGADQQPSPQQRNLFRFRASPTARDENAAFSLSPVGQDSQRVLASPRKAPRKISTVPYKVLDAPALQDDFYLNLVDWSSFNGRRPGHLRLPVECAPQGDQAVRPRARRLGDVGRVDAARHAPRGRHVGRRGADLERARRRDDGVTRRASAHCAGRAHAVERVVTG